MYLHRLRIPDTTLIWQAVEIGERCERIKLAFYEKDGALFWKSNDRPVPMHVFKEAYLEAPEAQKAADDAHTEAFLAEYRKQDHTPDAEQLAEMRAAFGPGETVVNIVTGQRTKL